MTHTRTLHPWELTVAGDTYQGKPIASDKVDMQAASFVHSVTRRISITLDIEDAIAIACRLPLENLPVCGKPLHTLIDEARS